MSQFVVTAAEPNQPMSWRHWWFFILAEVGISLFMFRDALWAKSLLAPLDIAPAFFSKYRYLDPASTGVPANHYTIDQLTFDLPVQYTIHRSLQRGEFPWWDPYTYGGMPLLADAHSNGTDLVRQVLYRLLPFEWAYNWTRVLHFGLCGLGMLLLLRHWQFPPWLAGGLAITYQLGGSHIYAFQHPWIQSSFLYYPFLWLVWDQAFSQPRRWHLPVASLLVAGIFYSGSLQTHSYLALFAGALALGYAGLRWAAWKRFLPHLVLAPILGACLAAPVLFGQVELFRNGLRTVSISPGPLSFLAGLFSLTAIYPWSLGTFRTLSLGKLIGENGLGFNLYVGSAVFVLAIFGAVSQADSPLHQRMKRAALLLLGIYFVILSSPLLQIFYVRCATLAVMALIILAGLAIQRLSLAATVSKRWAVFVLVGALLLAAGTNIGALLIYPRLMPKVEAFVAQRAQNNPTLEEAPALRTFQIRNLSKEVSFLNPETLLAFVALLAVAAFFYRSSLQTHRGAWLLLLALNLVPMLSYGFRFLPHQPIARWKGLLAGGPEQQRVMARLQDTPLRLWEIAPGRHERLMPGTFPSLYRVRAGHGYSSLFPRSLATLPASVQEAFRPQWADYIYESTERGQSAGTFVTNATPGWARFEWLGPGSRTLQPTDLGLTTQRIRLGSGEPGRLLWADSYSPGWRASAADVPLAIHPAPPCFAEIQVPPGIETIDLQYRPLHLRLGFVLASAALLGLLALLLITPGSKLETPQRR